MKRSFNILQSVQAVAIAALLSSCASPPQKIAKDEYFAPVDTVIRQKDLPGTEPKIMTRARSPVKMADAAQDTILEMIREQNKRLDEVSRQLSAMTQNAESSAVAQRYERMRGLLSDRNRLTNELLSEMIKEQNQRLNEIIGQLNTIVQNQHSLPQNGPKPAEPALAQAPVVAPGPSQRRFSASLSYGKAIEFYQSRQYEKAIHALKKLRDRTRAPELGAKCLFWMGVCHFHLGRLNEAMTAFQDVARRGSEKSEGARFMLGQCYERTGQKKLALETYEEMLRRYPSGKMKQIAEIKLALLR